MMSGLPVVSSRTCAMSSGRCQGRRPSLPMTLLRSNAKTNAIRPVALHRHLRFDGRMELVLLETRDRVEQRAGLLAGARSIDDLVVTRNDIVEGAQGGIERETRRGIGLALELLPSRVEVIAVHVRVREDVDELVRHQARELRDEVQHQRVLGHIERDAEEERSEERRVGKEWRTWSAR